MKNRLAAILGCVILTGAAIGCPNRGTVSSGGGNVGPVQQSASADDILKSAIHQLHPDVFGIAATPDKPVSLLNSWRIMTTPQGATTPPLLFPKGWLSESEEKRLAKDQFDDIDANFIRDTMLSHSMANYLAKRSNDELTRVQRVFEFVCRNIAVQNDDDPVLPMQIYQIMMLGRGTHEDRAWVFGSILRQLRIDAVILQPTSEPENSRENWLVGVVLSDQVYLFDIRLGLAIPSSETPKGFDERPATLAEIVQHPEWLKSLAVRGDQPYSIEAESLKSVRVMAMGEGNFWAHRMSRLEEVLPPEDLCVLYDPVVVSAEGARRNGLVARLVNAKQGWTADDLKLWRYPQQQLESFRKITAEISRAFQLAAAALESPIPIIQDPETKQLRTGQPERRMMKIRTDQLLGRFENTTERYLAMRRLKMDRSVPQLVSLYAATAENATYWTALSKMESDEFDSAIEQLTAYLREYQQGGRWTYAARSLLAEAHAKKGAYAKAISTVERQNSEDPYRDGNALRMKRWMAMKGN